MFDLKGVTVGSSSHCVLNACPSTGSGQAVTVVASQPDGRRFVPPATSQIVHSATLC